MNPGLNRPPTVNMPEYAPGLSIETEQDPQRHIERIIVTLRMGRVVEYGKDEALRGSEHLDALKRDLTERAVRQLQDEAITALGLNHWRDEVRREAENAERNERRRVLLALREAVRTAGTTDKAALLIQDEIDALGPR